MTASGPLAGLRVVEFAGLGPAPFACMLLADMGADVVRIARPGAPPVTASDILDRGRPTITLDLKDDAGRRSALQLLSHADVLIEGFRPGVMERLGLGPDAVRAANSRLVYARMTGWGQDGPLAHAAGHDINYIALAGALHAIGPAGGDPVPPLNLVGDFGGGALYLVTGVLAAVLEARSSGVGQTVDCAMVDGVASLMSMFASLRATGQWTHARGTNLFDGGAPHYATYACADGGHIAIGAYEPQFHALLCERLGIVDPQFADRDDRRHWPELRQKLHALFLTRTRDAWCALLEGTDACFAPVLSLTEAARHPHLAARGTFVTVDGVEQPAPAPRFSRTPSAVGRVPAGATLAIDAAVDRWSDAPRADDAGDRTPATGTPRALS